MSILPIVEAPDERLRKKSKPVKKLDKKIKKIISDMHQTLSAQKDPEGIGLAAPQVGKNLQIFVVNYDGKKITVINPKILKTNQPPTRNPKHKNTKTPLEGCLSIPHHYSPISRPKKIKIKYLDESGQEKTQEFTGFSAQVIAHEIDHLQGKLFIDHVLAQQTPLYKIMGEDWEEIEI
ncbi:peptide deformylase [Candidatus Woesebacteria bacterium RIFCSPHIGHO2_01_FULL_44_10]|uniref:Peptide deformylase n=1 Tax=Candidatus Woesebacteria bacterium RIFCSPLOWO2_01_FULL_44_14 TaxID=1802525 RepID=A0A1F8C5A6_9BACT|nr:MAG: peptide deformylase [Candidatus Woesebacteria bacterium RIFCSPHIGHO2_01_FULL_44_10]OGM56125.1 MAG: peptide deformylase [Candidatus Woesebacteria bacterium RIFCSPHIGHO2_12_FULL_44_11]OGM70928.1 MAG: peptide deformylase [Candidatus Woesebacteria bacterium RIFCSPLOWO2_01_FULL_44_14]